MTLATARKRAAFPPVEVEPPAVVEQQAATPRYKTELLGAVPNPFNPSTQIRFSLAEAGEVTVKVYNLRGAQVSELLVGPRDAGLHTVDWTGADDHGQSVASGVYVVELTVQGAKQRARVTLVR